MKMFNEYAYFTFKSIFHKAFTVCLFDCEIRLKSVPETNQYQPMRSKFLAQGNNWSLWWCWNKRHTYESHATPCGTVCLQKEMSILRSRCKCWMAITCISSQSNMSTYKQNYVTDWSKNRMCRQTCVTIWAHLTITGTIHRVTYTTTRRRTFLMTTVPIVTRSTLDLAVYTVEPRGTVTHSGSLC